jgi:hypothetical protein
MQLLNLAIDCNGVLVDWHDKPNQQVVDFIKFIHDHTKNCRIIVWSKRGEAYAQGWVDKLGLQDYVWRVGDKADEWFVDIALDDEHAFEKAHKDIIVGFR